MRVKATKKGFYKKLRRAGDEFILTARIKEGSKADIENDIKAQFSESWMKELPTIKVSARSRKSS